MKTDTARLVLSLAAVCTCILLLSIVYACLVAEARLQDTEDLTLRDHEMRLNALERRRR